ITAEEQSYISNNALTNSALRLFSESWMVWRHRQCVCSAAVTRSTNLTLARTSVDPREFDISHWYESCGRLGHVFYGHKTLGIPSQAPPVTPRTPDRPSEFKPLDAREI